MNGEGSSLVPAGPKSVPVKWFLVHTSCMVLGLGCPLQVVVHLNPSERVHGKAGSRLRLYFQRWII